MALLLSGTLLAAFRSSVLQWRSTAAFFHWKRLFIVLWTSFVASVFSVPRHMSLSVNEQISHMAAPRQPDQTSNAEERHLNASLVLNQHGKVQDETMKRRDEERVCGPKPEDCLLSVRLKRK